MTETYLQFAWRFCLFTSADLRTTRGESVTVQNTGFLNTDAGPDFLYAKMGIGDQMWSGHVEIHVRASEWYDHKHHLDPDYDNVILHVVYKADEQVFSNNSVAIPTVDLSKYVDESYLDKYESMIKERSWIPCASKLGSVRKVAIKSWIDGLMVGRIEEKKNVLLQNLEVAKNDWTEMLYRSLARSFGLKVNADNFEMLATFMPVKILMAHRDSQFQIEALLFGQAGMLNEAFVDEYPKALQNEYVYLKKKMGLVAMSGKGWKYLRMMPANFPSLRIAQLAKLIYERPSLLSEFKEWEDPDQVFGALSVHAHDYWKTHSAFDKPCKLRSVKFGKSRIEGVIINTAVPYIFLYAERVGTSDMAQRGVDLLERCKPENNKITRGWKALGQEIPSAAQSQAYIQLYNSYCTPKKCLNCGIGAELLRSDL